MKAFIRKLLPASFLQLYHRALAVFAAAWYRHPSRELTVIGVTGTNGKSTVVAMLARLLDGVGHRSGATSTVSFKIGEKEWLNDLKLTMPGRFTLQRMLRRMVDAGCDYAVIETSSEGIRQYRHLGIEYDVAVFTNLSPEHIESHGSYEAYRDAKVELFRHLSRLRTKDHPKFTVVNLDDPEADHFLKPHAGARAGFSMGNPQVDTDRTEVYEVTDMETSRSGVSFTLHGTRFTSQLLGRFNIENLAAALVVAKIEGLHLRLLTDTVQDLNGVPGRLEFIREGQPFTVIVDYAPEPNALKKSYEAIDPIPRRRLIHVLGSAGGGRDAARRPILGSMAAQQADVVVVTNEDPYDEDPQKIINQVAQGATDHGKVLNQDLFTFIDRREAIQFALQQAKDDDLVYITGKGAEQAMMTKHGKVPWDDRRVVRKHLKKLHG